MLELGRIESQESRYTEARKCYEAALEIFRAHGNRAGEGPALGSLGNVYQSQGPSDEAIAHYTQALAIAREIGDKRSEGFQLGDLGSVYLSQGQFLSSADRTCLRPFFVLVAGRVVDSGCRLRQSGRTRLTEACGVVATVGDFVARVEVTDAVIAHLGIAIVVHVQLDEAHTMVQLLEDGAALTPGVRVVGGRPPRLEVRRRE